MFFSWVVRNKIKFAAYLKKHNHVHNNDAMLGMTSAFCPTFLFQPYVYLHYVLLSRFPQMYKILAIYSVNGSQETRETWNISRAR